MTQKEFEDLTGLKVDPKTYELVNGMYMANDTMEKRQFCKMFKEMNLGKWAEEQANYIRDLRDGASQMQESTARAEKESAKRIEELEAEVRGLKQRQRDFYLMAVVMLHNYQQDMLCQAIAKQIGAKEYLMALKGAELAPTKGDLDIFVKMMEELEASKEE